MERHWIQRDVWRLKIVQLSGRRNPPLLEQLDRRTFKIAWRAKQQYLWITRSRQISCWLLWERKKTKISEHPWQEPLSFLPFPFSCHLLNTFSGETLIYKSFPFSQHNCKDMYYVDPISVWDSMVKDFPKRQK